MIRSLLMLLLCTLPAWAGPYDSGGTAAASLSPDGKVLATGHARKIVKLWDVASGRLLRKLAGPGPAVTERSFSPDSSYPVEDRVTTLAFSPDGSRLVAAGEDGVVRIWAVDGKLRASHDDAYEVNRVAFSPAGDRVGYLNNSTRYLESSVVVWDFQKAKLTWMGGGTPHSGTVSGFAFSPDGSRVASWADDGVAVWSSENGEAVLRLEVSSPTSAAWAPEGTTLAVGGSGQVRLFSLPTREALATLPAAGKGGVYALAYAPGGVLLAGVIGENAVVWQVPLGKKVLGTPAKRLLGWTAQAELVLQRPDGRIAWIDPFTGKVLRSAPR